MILLLAREMKNNITYFLMNYGIIISFIIVLVILFTVLYTVIKNRKKKKKQALPIVDKNEIYIYLGGANNIISKSLNGSRLTVELKDVSLLNKDKLKSLGVTNIISMSNKITLVLNNNLKQLEI